jgi:hypothetical protein
MNGELIARLAENAKNAMPEGVSTEEWIKLYNEKLVELVVEEIAELFHLRFTDEQYQRRIDKTIRKHFGVDYE